MTISVVGDTHYGADKLFSEADPALNRDNCLRPWILLKAELNKRGHEIHTHDVVPPESADLRIYSEFDPAQVPATPRGSLLLLLESPIVRMASWERKNWSAFQSVLGWAPAPTSENYHQIRIPYAAPIPAPAPFGPVASKLLCLIAGNKESHELGELYSARRKTVRWFEASAPTDFDLFGQGWDRGSPRLSGLPRRALAKVGLSWSRPFPSYRGPATSKREVLSQYRFTLAFENVEGFPGYITEKIFDPMFAGCVPIYRGAPDIGTVVPRDCYIDGAAFPSPAALHRHLSDMPERTYQTYREAMQRFLVSGALAPFSPEVFARRVSDVLVS